ncbi:MULTISPECIES: hypothetical protein [unclassified Nonomuraea]
MIKVRIQVEDDGRSITVQDTIRDDAAAVEVLASAAYGVWRAALSAE